MSQPDAGLRSDVVSASDDLRARHFAAQFQASIRTLWLVAVGIVRDAALAEDVVQEAAIIALQKLDQFRPESNFTAWTGQIVRNVALNRARKERKRRAASLDSTTKGEAAPDRPEPHREMTIGPGGRLPMNQPYFDDRLMKALDSLSETARTCLLLRTLEGMTYARIAELLGIPEGTAMSHVHRSRAFLRQHLTDLGQGPPTQTDPTP